MRKAPCLLAVISVGSLFLTNSTLANPLKSGLASAQPISPAFTWVEKVQLWSCRERYRDMTAEQGRFCFGYGYGPRYGYGYASPRYGYGYGYPRYGDYGYPYGLAFPFLGFGLDSGLAITTTIGTSPTAGPP
jgi:hypothetical protein